MPGLKIGTKLVDVPGVDIIAPGETPWAHLDRMDCRTRRTRWVRQIILHTTKGEWPQHVVPGRGPANRDERVARFWQGSERQSAAHIVIDSDGSAACLADLLEVEAYHATVVNRWSVGIEIYQEADGGVYEAALTSAVRIVAALCRAFGVQFQIPARPYLRRPLTRLASDGGPDVVGIFGHRDVTDNRGKGDPGEAVWDFLEAAGAEVLDYENGADLIVWKARQLALGVAADGVPGPLTVKALKANGHPDGLFRQPFSVHPAVKR